MEIIDVSNLKQNLKAYGGLACLKIGVTYEGKDYLLKFPGIVKNKALKDVELSYSNSSVCEYLGSNMYNLFGIDVHNTILAKRNDKIVVMCEDFIKSNMRLYEFREIKATYEPAFRTTLGEVTDGTGSDIDEAILVINNHPTMKLIPNAEERFWQMFIIDAIIGNPDRNNGNWGIIITNNTEVSLAPVYDNGNSFNDKWDDAKMNKFLENEESIINEAWKGKINFFTKEGGRINPFKLLESGVYPESNKVLHSLLKKADFSKIENLITTVDLLTETQKKFYLNILKLRMDKLNDIDRQFTIASKIENSGPKKINKPIN